MTKAQQRIVEILKERFIKEKAYSGNVDNYEYKKFEVEECKRVYSNKIDIYIFASVGKKNDENTLASIYCRDNVHVRIGVRGGITVINAKRKSDSKGMINALHAAKKY